MGMKKAPGSLDLGAFLVLPLTSHLLLLTSYLSPLTFPAAYVTVRPTARPARASTP